MTRSRESWGGRWSQRKHELVVWPHGELWAGALGRVVGIALLAITSLASVFVSNVWGATASARWTVSSLAAPSSFSVNDSAKCVVEGETNPQYPECDSYFVTAMNVGSAATSGEFSFSDTVPVGLEIQEARVYLSEFGNGESDIAAFACSTPGQTITCNVPGFIAVGPDGTAKMLIFVKVEEGAKFEGACPAGLPASTGCVENEAAVEGGSAGVAHTAEPLSRANLVNGPSLGFGFAGFSFGVDGSDGAPDSTAGDHPYELDTTVYLNTKFRVGPDDNYEAGDVQDTRDVVVNLPPGLVGSVLATPQCTFAQLSSHILSGVGGCPRDTIVGHIQTEPSSQASINGPIYNMVPERGQAAEFAFVDVLAGTHVLYSHVEPSPQGYVLQAVSPEIPQTRLKSIQVEFYGDPAERNETAEERAANGTPVVPFFTTPTQCLGEEPIASIYMDSWQNPARLTAEGVPADLEEPQWAKAQSRLPAMTGCNLLQLNGVEVEAQPTSHAADSTSGLDYEVKVPQTEKNGVPATPTVHEIVTNLPVGLSIDPSAGTGLQACSEAQIGWLGVSPSDFDNVPPACPDASKVGTLELESPLIAGKILGEVFIAAQNENPFKATFATYVVVHDPRTGVLVKVAGELVPDHTTGQVRAIFAENPNFPFSALHLHFFDGPRASLATPQSCGGYTTGTELTPWSLLPGSGSPLSVLSSFTIDQSCAIGFSPSFTASSVNAKAGAFTPFVTSLQRADSDQELGGLSVTLPAGVLAKLTGVPECTDAEIHQAEEGTGGCPEASSIGTVRTGAGPGPDPLFVSGRAYLTGPYNGGSYGLAVVVPAVAGPYDLGTVVVRQSLRIDPHTARVTDVSDPFPRIIDGVPLRVRRVDLTIERPEFTFNPTNCNTLSFEGALTGIQPGSATSLAANGNIGYGTQAGASSTIAAPFQANECRALKFSPKIAVQVKARASKANGQSLRFAIVYPKNSLGSQSWLGETKFDIPKQLPSRLETIQQACTVETFETNRKACPSASIIGHAVVRTPALPEPLEGPLYFVSYANKKFPETVLVLKGDNVTIEQHGETFINHKTGVTSATFHAIPDAPIESIEVTLPAGPFSEFGSNIPARDRYNFCGQKLVMPTFFKAQNGLEIRQSTKIAIVGCKAPRHSPKHRHSARKKAH